jgi:hypothetical protein
VVPVYCPPVVPAGRTISDGTTGVMTQDFASGFFSNFESSSIRPTRTTPGHWSVAEGEPAALRRLLKPATAQGEKPPRIRHTKIRVAGRSATLWLMPSFRVFHGVYGGHVVLAWRCGARAYQASAHGHRNRGVVRLIAEGLIEEMRRGCA